MDLISLAKILFKNSMIILVAIVNAMDLYVYRGSSQNLFLFLYLNLNSLFLRTRLVFNSIYSNQNSNREMIYAMLGMLAFLLFL